MRRVANVMALLLVLAVSGTVFAKAIRAPAKANPTSGQQARVVSPAQHQAARPIRTLSLRGTVCGVDEKANTITFMVERTAQLDPQVEISSNGKRLGLSEVEKGDKVVMTATERHGKLVASRVEVAPAHPAVARTPHPSSKLAGETPSGPASHRGVR